MDLSFIVIFIWLGCFILVAVDSAIRGVSSVFWRLAGLTIMGAIIMMAMPPVSTTAQAKDRASQIVSLWHSFEAKFRGFPPTACLSGPCGGRHVASCRP